MWHQRALAIVEMAAAHGVELVVVLGWIGNPQQLQIAVTHPHLRRVSRAVLSAIAAQTTGEGLAGVQWTTAKWTALATGPARALLAAPGRGQDPGQALLDGRPVLINVGGMTPVDSAVVGHVLLSAILDRVLGAEIDPAPARRLRRRSSPRGPDGAHLNLPRPAH